MDKNLCTKQNFLPYMHNMKCLFAKMLIIKCLKNIQLMQYTYPAYAYVEYTKLLMNMVSALLKFITTQI